MSVPGAGLEAPRARRGSLPGPRVLVLPRPPSPAHQDRTSPAFCLCLSSGLQLTVHLEEDASLGEPNHPVASWNWFECSELGVCLAELGVCLAECPIWAQNAGIWVSCQWMALPHLPCHVVFGASL